MKKNICYLSIILIIALIICGCSDGNSKVETTTEEINQQNKVKWEHEKLDEYLFADFEIKERYPNKVAQYEGKLAILSPKDIKEAFFQNDKSEQKIEKEMEEPDFPQFGYRYTLTTKNGTEISTFAGDVIGETEECKYYNNFLGTDFQKYDITTGTQNIGTEDELKFLSKEKIEKSISSGLKKLGLAFKIEKFNFHAMSSKYLNTIQAEGIKNTEQVFYDKKYLKTWKEDEGAYYVTVNVSLDGLQMNECYVPDEFSDERYAENMELKYIYNKNGCVYLDMVGIPELDTKKESKVISAEEALRVLKDDMTSVILSQKYTINSCRLRYTTMQVGGDIKINLIPVWFFSYVTYNQVDDQKVPSTHWGYVNAITGKVIH